MAGNESQAPAEGDPISQMESSLGSLWARYSSGSRPKDATVAIEGGVVRWRLPKGIGELESAFKASAELPPDEQRTAIGFRRDAIAAVTKATGRKVAATGRKKDAATGAVTEAFILEFIPPKY